MFGPPSSDAFHLVNTRVVGPATEPAITLTVGATASGGSESGTEPLEIVTWLVRITAPALPVMVNARTPLGAERGTSTVSVADDPAAGSWLNEGDHARGSRRRPGRSLGRTPADG